MARKSYRQKKNYYYKKNWNNFKKSSSVVSRAWKSIKEANKTNSTLDFAFKINYAFTVRYDGKSNAGGSDAGVAVLNIYDILQKSENFQNMSKSWDQIKINGVTCKLNITDGMTTFTQGADAWKTINIVTGWDRTGLTPSSDIVFYERAQGNLEPNEISQDHWDDPTKKCYSYKNVVGSRLSEGYGCKKGLLNQYQRFNRYEKLFPETLDEKCCYVSCGNINEFNGGYDVVSSMINLTGDYSDMSVMGILSSPNPAIPFEQPSIKWKPTLLVGAFRTTVTTSTDPDTSVTSTVLTQYGPVDPIVFNGEFTIPVTFKGQKGDR